MIYVGTWQQKKLTGVKRIRKTTVKMRKTANWKREEVAKVNIVKKEEHLKA